MVDAKGAFTGHLSSSNTKGALIGGVLCPDIRDSWFVEKPFDSILANGSVEMPGLHPAVSFTQPDPRRDKTPAIYPSH